MNFIEELQARNLIQDLTPGLEEHLDQKKPVTAYIGFDPTAPSLTIGNYVPIMLLKLFQLSGHQPIMLFGGATGRIGDPSGKSAERTLKSAEEIEANLAAQKAQAKALLQPQAGLKDVIFVDNYEFYKDLNVLNFLRDVGKTLTVNYMMTKDSVKNRLETGLSFTEFSYQLLQGYDFQCLYESHGCTLQMGGSDQWGNITSGTEFVRRNLQGKAFGLTCPLLTKADGSKFGKSESGNIWLDPTRTSPYRFYQFWLNASDADLPTYLRYFSLQPTDEILAKCKVVEEHLAGTDRFVELSTIKQTFAAEMTTRVHGESALESAKKATALLFNRKAGADQLRALTAEELQTIYEEVPSTNLSKSLLSGDGVALIDLLAEHGNAAASKSEARRAIQANAVAVNKEKISDPELKITETNLLQHRFVMLENGKKNKLMIAFN